MILANDCNITKSKNLRGSEYFSYPLYTDRYTYLYSDCVLGQVEGRTSVIETFNQLIREEGFWGMTKGLSARIISSTPTAIVMVVGYETLKKLSLRPELVDSRHW